MRRMFGEDIYVRVAIGLVLGALVVSLFPVTICGVTNTMTDWTRWTILPLVWVLVAREVVGMAFSPGMKPDAPIWRLAALWYIVTLGLGVVMWLLYVSHVTMFVLVCAIVATDIGAYGVGRLWKTCARRGLLPQPHTFSKHSPSKTWEGVAGGIVASVVVALWLLHVFAVPVAAAVYPCLPLIPVMAIWGDLFESRAKRDCAVKDSSTTLGPHGGLLDRLDSITAVLAAPLTLMLMVVSYVVDRHSSAPAQAS